MDLLKDTGMSDCKPSAVPIDPNSKLKIDEGDSPVDKEWYQRLIGRLIFLNHTRPDIAYVVGLLSQFMNDPRESHWQAALRVLAYLKGTPGHGLFFKRHGGLKLEVFTDADFGGSMIDRSSTSAYCSFLGGNLVTWKSKKQSDVSLSSAEAEFRSLLKGICEAIWLRNLLIEIGFPTPGPAKMKCNNKSAIAICLNPVHHDRTKHLGINRHFIRKKIDKKIISLDYVPSADQRADMLT